MNNIFTKKKITTFFTYYGVLSLALALVIFFGWSYVLNAIDEVKKYEKVNIFMETYGVNETLEKNIYDYVKEKDETKLIYEVNIYQYASDNSKITSYYESFGKNADILILTEEDLTDMKEYVEDNFLELSDDLLEKTLGEKKNLYSYYDYDGKNYAIKISDKDDKNYSYLSEQITYSEEGKEEHSYYLLLNLNSVNIGTYAQESKTENALFTLSYLLGE